MKSERRHDLETNELARRLEVGVERVRPYSNTILICVLGLVVLVAGMWFFKNRSEAKRKQAWDLYTVVMTSRAPNWDTLRKASQENAGSSMSDWAELTWADAELQTATSEFFSNRAGAETRLESAKKVYEGLIDSAENAVVRSRAQLGLARIYETEGSIPKAKELYSAIEGIYAEHAQARAKALDAKNAQEEATWLADVEPPTAPAPEGPGIPGSRPPFGPGMDVDPALPTGTGSTTTGGPTLPNIPGAGTSGEQGASLPDLPNLFDAETQGNRYGDENETEADGESDDSPAESAESDSPSSTEDTAAGSADAEIESAADETE